MEDGGSHRGRERARCGAVRAGLDRASLGGDGMGAESERPSLPGNPRPCTVIGLRGQRTAFIFSQTAM